MVKRDIITIDEDLCNGCKACVPNCPEGAIQIIDGKARLISDLFCDGLGACIGHCPTGAISIEKRESMPYDEKKTMENIVKHGKNTIVAHLKHLKDHRELEYLRQANEFLKENKIKIDIEDAPKEEFHGCPGSRTMVLNKDKKNKIQSDSVRQDSELSQWPVQLHLVSPYAPYLKGADLLIAADCVPFAYPNFHSDFLKGRAVVIACPKLDDTDGYKEKLIEMIKNNDLKSITVVNMEVPCCFGLQALAEEAIRESGKVIPLRQTIITISGEKQ